MYYVPYEYNNNINYKFYLFLGYKIDTHFSSYALIEPKLIHARHKREIHSTKANPVSK